MTIEEFSNEFDVLYNNIMSNQAPGLDEYEKSVFLTKAQNEVVKNYFNVGNRYQEGYDGSMKRQADFSMLMVSENLSTTGSNGDFDSRAWKFNVPDNLFLFINEQIKLLNSGSASTIDGVRQVIPLTFAEYTAKMSKPYKYPLKWQAWRLLTGTATSGKVAEILLNSTDNVSYGKNFRWSVRYVKKPQPIILVDLEDAYGEGLSIDGQTEASGCELDSELHPEILQRAVELAKVAYEGDATHTQLQISAGQRSE